MGSFKKNILQLGGIALFIFLAWYVTEKLDPYSFRTLAFYGAGIIIFIAGVIFGENLPKK